MSTQSAFHRGVQPLLQLLLPGKEADVLSIQPDHDLRERIEHLLAVEGEAFVGGQCHSSADAIISHEARGHAVATKDKDLKPICKACGTEFVHIPHQ